jgi:hypothetical protein
VLVSFGTYAQQDSSAYNNWKVRISPYLWFVGFKGTVYRPPQIAQLPEPTPTKSIDVSFKDIRNDIKFFLMIAAEYRTKKISVQMNSSTIILESTFFTPFELILQNSVVNFKFSSGDLSAGYRLINTDKLELDPLLGMKYVFFDVSVKTKLIGLPITGERSSFVAEPIIGLKSRYRPLPRLELFGYIDYGFIPDRDQTFQTFGGVTYMFSRVFNTSISYRYWTIEVPVSEAIYNGSVLGWLLKFGFQF